MITIPYENKVEIPPHSKMTFPEIPVGHPKFIWTNGADVQKTWSRFGWKPVNPLESGNAKR